MPQRAPRLCPRCGGTYRSARCPVCDQRREERQPKGTARRTDYKSARWVRESKAYLAQHHLCECEKCEALPEWERDVAEHVDHRDGRGMSGPREWDWSNWQALSLRHHSTKTALHDGGFGNKKQRPADNEPAPF